MSNGPGLHLFQDVSGTFWRWIKETKCRKAMAFCYCKAFLQPSSFKGYVVPVLLDTFGDLWRILSHLRYLSFWAPHRPPKRFDASHQPARELETSIREPRSWGGRGTHGSGPGLLQQGCKMEKKWPLEFEVWKTCDMIIHDPTLKDYPSLFPKKGGNLGIYHTISYIIILYASSEKPYIIDMMSWVRTIALKPFVRFMLSWNLGMSWLSIGYRECGWFHNKKYRNPRGWWSCLAAERQRLPWWPWARNSPAGNWKPYFGMDGSCPNGDSSTFWLVKNMFFSQNWEVWWPEASSSRMGCCTTCPSSCEGISCCLERNTRVTWKFLSTEWRDQLDRNILYIYIVAC